jgi:hypothetical protein
LVLALQLFLLVTRADAATTIIRVGYPQLNGGQTPLWNIPENKIDRQYGIEINPVYIPGESGLPSRRFPGRLTWRSPAARLSMRCSAERILSTSVCRSQPTRSPFMPARNQRGARPARQSSWSDKQHPRTLKIFMTIVFLQELESTGFVKELYGGK